MITGETSMVSELLNTMRTKFNKESLALKLPNAFDGIKEKNTEMEMKMSSSI